MRPTTSSADKPESTSAIPDLSGIQAWLFDLDGVLTPTALVHMQAWARLFSPFLESQGAEPYSDADYFAHIDGKPRYDGVRSLLASRGIFVPEGQPADPPTAETVHGLGNQKNVAFANTLEVDGVTPYATSVAFLEAVEAAGCHVAVVSSSRNARAVLRAAGLLDRFEVIVDGEYAAAERIPGKPAPDTYTRAAELLGVPTVLCAVVEDAESGVEAGAAGEFGVVVGVDRGVGPDRLAALGADIVVSELDELIASLPSGFSMTAEGGKQA